MADQEEFQQIYLSSMARTQTLFQKNKERWNKRKEIQLANLLKEHVMAEGIPLEPNTKPEDQDATKSF